jgi:hypothetical protein
MTPWYLNEVARFWESAPAVWHCLTAAGTRFPRLDNVFPAAVKRHTSRIVQVFLAIVALLAMVALMPGESRAAQPPVAVGEAQDAFLVTTPDGAVDMIFARSTVAGAEVARKRTTDGGRSWSEPETVYRMGPKSLGAPLPLATRGGGLVLFWMVERATGGRPAVDYFIDIWEAHSRRGQDAWTQPQRIFEGYVGSINGMAQLDNGRIVLPFAYWLGGQAEAPPSGCNITTVIYSDDGGATWKQSPSKLTAPCYAGYNGANYGAVEPTILPLRDGRVWMLIRTQTGWLYESFSRDGATWSEATPTRFCSSDSPAWLLRLPDGRIVLFWNNCENTSRINGEGVYTNRDALHAAISADEGKTWLGYREVYRDPRRNQSPPRTGDRGTAYPYATATRDGKILLVTGQGSGRRLILRVDPQWLEETCQEDDLSRGLDGWTVFTSFGPASGWWRDRSPGPQLVDHPSRPRAKALHVRRADEKDGDGAVWNFPIGRQGRVAVRFRLQPGCQGVSFALADRMIQPTDDVGEKKVLFVLPIAAGGRIPHGPALEAGRWYALGLHWDLDKQCCEVLVDGRPAGVLPARNKTSPGVCYLRLRSTALAKDPAGILVESVQAQVGSPLIQHR